MMREGTNRYDARYAGEEHYWGEKPSALADRVIKIVAPQPDWQPTLIDLGCGEGRNAVHFARHGFRVTGVDTSLRGLEKLKNYSAEAGVDIDAVRADIANYLLPITFDVVSSTGAVHFIPPQLRRARFEHLKAQTAQRGIHAHSALVGKPFIPAAPDADPEVVLFTSGELLSYYWEWEILFSVEEIFDCTSGGVPHKHAVSRVVARNVVNRLPQDTESATTVTPGEAG
jgi:tellurite methyltransferase